MDDPIIDRDRLLQQLVCVERRHAELIAALQRWVTVATPDQRLSLACELHRRLPKTKALATEIVLGLALGARPARVRP